MKIAVIGCGVVGSHMVADCRRAPGVEVVEYDPPREMPATRADVNACEAAFICVGTPERADGAADLSAIHEVFFWLRVPVAIIRSTVPPGTTAQLPGEVVFSPEFIGEGVNPAYNQLRQPPFLILGGTPSARAKAAAVCAKLYNSECEFIFLDAITAEVGKYFENVFLATKVTLVNEFYTICQVLGADYYQMIAAVTHDHRIGRSHTHVYPDARGWGGRCLPKDTAALLALVGEETAPLLAAVRRVNELHRRRPRSSEEVTA